MRPDGQCDGMDYFIYTTTAQVFRGTGPEPWAYDVAGATAKRLEDLSPGFTLRCNDL